MDEEGAARVDGALDDRNEVRLRGRLTSAPERRELPSGDELVQLRVTVARATAGVDTFLVIVGPGPGPGRRAAAGRIGRRHLAAAESLEVDTCVEVEGTLRRRWWATAGGRHSRVEVAATRVAPVAVTAR
jgi:single-strand DNA-binding protein